MTDLDWDSPLPGGNESEEYAERLANDVVWQKVSAQVKERDKCCQMCGATTNLRAHHFSYCDFYNPEYLITLCDKCHSDVHEITKAYKEFYQSTAYKEAIATVNEAISANVIDPFILKRCAELNPDGDIRFFTGSRDKRVNINNFIDKLISLDPYKYGLQAGNGTGYAIRKFGNSAFTRYQNMRLKKEGRR